MKILKFSLRPSRAYFSSKSRKTVFACKGGSLFLFCNRICFKIYISFTVLSGVHMYIPFRIPKNEIETLTLTCKKMTWVPKWKISMDLHSLSQQTEVRWSVFRTIIEETNIPVLLICPNRFFLEVWWNICHFYSAVKIILVQLNLIWDSSQMCFSREWHTLSSF